MTTAILTLKPTFRGTGANRISVSAGTIIEMSDADALAFQVAGNGVDLLLCDGIGITKEFKRGPYTLPADEVALPASAKLDYIRVNQFVRDPATIAQFDAVDPDATEVTEVAPVVLEDAPVEENKKSRRAK